PLPEERPPGQPGGQARRSDAIAHHLQEALPFEGRLSEERFEPTIADLVFAKGERPQLARWRTSQGDRAGVADAIVAQVQVDELLHERGIRQRFHSFPDLIRYQYELAKSRGPPLGQRADAVVADRVARGLQQLDTSEESPLGQGGEALVAQAG